MKVTVSDENLLEFDNGLKVVGTHEQSCCEHNYLDFEQLPVGTELEDMNAAEFASKIRLKEDGFSIEDIDFTPKWVQARSQQNGYYSTGLNLEISDADKTVVIKKPNTSEYDETFDAKLEEY